MRAQRFALARFNFFLAHPHNAAQKIFALCEKSMESCDFREPNATSAIDARARRARRAQLFCEISSRIACGRQNRATRNGNVRSREVLQTRRPLRCKSIATTRRTRVRFVERCVRTAIGNWKCESLHGGFIALRFFSSLL